MPGKPIVAVLCCFLLVHVSVAEPTTSVIIGKLSSNGPAQVNGALTPAGTTIFTGDRIANQKESATALSLTDGSQLILAGLGSLEMKGDGRKSTAALERGRLAVLSRGSIVVTAAGTRIHAVNGDAVYAVTVDGNELQVIASKGEAEVEGAGRTVKVSEGHTLDATMQPPDRPSDPPPAATTSLFTFQTVVIVVTAAVAVVALGLAIKSLGRTCRSTGSPATVRCD